MKFIVIILLVLFVVIGCGLAFLSFADIDIAQTEITKEIPLQHE
jgi:uncharacterized protein YxeA